MPWKCRDCHELKEDRFKVANDYMTQCPSLTLIAFSATRLQLCSYIKQQNGSVRVGGILDVNKVVECLFD